jgi:hypothetical protein
MESNSIVTSLIDSQRSIQHSKKMIVDCFKTRLVQILKESGYKFFVFAYGSKEYDDQGFSEGYVNYFIFTNDSSDITVQNFWDSRTDFYFEDKTDNLSNEMKKQIQDNVKELFECFNSYSFY